MPHILRWQPFRALYLAYAALILAFVRIPFLCLCSLPRSQRPRRSWNMTRVVMVDILRHLFKINRAVGKFLKYPTHLAIAPGKGVNGVWVDPVPQFIKGQLKIWADIASVYPVSIPGYWVHKKGLTIPVAAPPMPGEKVIYVLHGGGYGEFSAHPNDITAPIAAGLLEYCDTVHRTFAIEYRLSAVAPDPPANAFPAALVDALAGYNYLVNEIGFVPSNIIVEGDSAGGNLTLALTRYLVEHQTNVTFEGEVCLPAPPGATILVCPWSDLGQSHDVLGGSAFEHIRSDFLCTSQTNTFAAGFLGPHDVSELDVNRYISPGSVHPSMKVSFVGFPRTFIVAGGAEILLDQIRTLRDKMVADLGEGDGGEGSAGKVTYYEAKDGIHDYLAFSWHEPERGDTFKALAKWMSVV